MAHHAKGALYLVATPIGNLGDITLRALRILKEVDLIASEDTRTTRKLLSAYEVHTPLVSYHEQGGAGKRADWLIAKVLEGKKLALVSEAGTPGISDPGYALIRGCISVGIDIVSIPGPSVLLAALSVSGLSMDRFVFEGFLPRRGSQRIAVLKALCREPRTLVFFESPRRLEASLLDALQILGDRKAAVIRELTKAFEEVRRGSLRELLEWARSHEVKGEVTVTIQGHAEKAPTDNELQDRVRFLKHRCGLAERDVVRVVREELGVPKKLVYRAVLQEREASSP